MGMSEITEALTIAALIPKLHAKAVERASAAICRLPVNDLHVLADAIENYYATAPTFQSGTGALAVAIMKELGAHVRVAEWHVVDGRCEHKQYNVGSTTRAKIGEVGDSTWIEAWIA